MLTSITCCKCHICDLNNCDSLHLLQVYGRVYRVVEPKRQRLNAATQQLKEKQFQLQEAKDKLAEVSHSTCNNSQGVII